MRIKRIVLDLHDVIADSKKVVVFEYRRYVDDTFCLFHSEHDAILFFDFINSRHPNIRFTMEKEAHRKLPFLDVLVDNNDPNSLLTRVYRKKTFTGLLTNYFSFTSYSYKRGLIRTLVDRAYKINNTWLGLQRTLLSSWIS